MSARVLVVEDDGLVRKAMTLALERAGYEVTAIAAGDSAYAALCDGPVDLVLLDWSIPHISADALVLAMVRRWPHLAGRVVVMCDPFDDSMYSLPEDLGSCPRLPKPFTVQELYRTVSTLLAPPQRRQRQGHDSA